MIIVEGCDGTGKTSLVERLQRDLRIPLHRRASSSLEGPRQDLFEWARHDVDTMAWQPFSVYDRHPLISAFVYGPVLGIPANLDERFHTSEGDRISTIFADRVMVILCDPGIVEVEKNIVGDQVETTKPQMAGVIEHWRNLYHAYRSLIHYWPGYAMVWDYRYPDLYPHLMSACVEFMSTKRNDPNA